MPEHGKESDYGVMFLGSTTAFEAAGPISLGVTYDHSVIVLGCPIWNGVRVIGSNPIHST